jgi:hypothetical protein
MIDDLTHIDQQAPGSQMTECQGPWLCSEEFVRPEHLLNSSIVSQRLKPVPSDCTGRWRYPLPPASGDEQSFVVDRTEASICARYICRHNLVFLVYSLALLCDPLNP